MARNDERTTTANAIIVHIDPKTMEATTEETTVKVPYTRTVEKAAVSIREILGLGAMDLVKVQEPLIQDEYVRKVYDPTETYRVATLMQRTYSVHDDGSDEAQTVEEFTVNVAGCKRIVVDTYDYSIAALVQRPDASYAAVKIRAYNVTECRAGIGSAQAYAEDVLKGYRDGSITVYGDSGTVMYEPGEYDYSRVAAWDAESKYRACTRVACYLRDSELAEIPFTVYRRGGDDK